MIMHPNLKILWGAVLCGVFGITVAAAQTADLALTRRQAYARATQLETLGRGLFFDPSLSASGQMHAPLVMILRMPWAHPTLCRYSSAARTCENRVCGRCLRSNICRSCRRSPSIITNPTTRATVASTTDQPVA